MAKRILNRKELRADYDAAERRKGDDEEVAEDEEEAEDEEGEEEEEGEEGEGEAEDEAEDEEGGDEDDEDAPKKKKKPKPKPVKVKAKPKPRTRAAKVTRMRVLWCVFNNSNQKVATYEYPRRKEAEEHAARLTADKKNTHFVQPVKEPIEEKKEA